MGCSGSKSGGKDPSAKGNYAKVHPGEKKSFADSVKRKFLAYAGGPFGLATAEVSGQSGLLKDVETAGIKAIDQLAEYLCKICTGLALNGKELDEVLELMSLSKFKAQVVEAAGYNSDSREFIVDVAACAKLNPVLVAFAAEVIATNTISSFFPPASVARDAELKRAVVYCYFLQGVTKMIMYEKKGENALFKQIADIFNEVRGKTDWKKYCNLFETMKITSVDIPIAYFLDLKVGKIVCKEEAGSGWGLSLNILEAMYQDQKLGLEDNRRAGFELMIEPGSRAPIKGLGNAVTSDFNPEMGWLSIKPPFPRVWANIYQSWNLAFCMNYADYPFFFAKLLNPIVAGAYQRVDEGFYLHPRVVALWIHIQREVAIRVKNKQSAPIGLDWRNLQLQILWGKVNEAAASDFQRRVEKTIDDNHGVDKEIAYDLKRGGVRVLWKDLEELIDAAVLLGDSGERAVAEFAKLRVKLLGESHSDRSPPW